MNPASEHGMDARKLALVASLTDNAVIITDPQGQIEWVNESFTRITGYRIDEVRGRKPGSFLQGKHTDPQTIAMMHDQLSRGEGFKTEVLNYGKDGRVYWLAIEVQPIRNEEGELLNFMAIESDITAQREAARTARTQLEVAQALAKGTPIPEILRVLAENLRYDAAVLWLDTPEVGSPFCAELWCEPTMDAAGFEAAMRKSTLQRDRGLGGRAWTARLPVSLETIGVNGFETTVVADLHACLAAPLISSSRVLGVLEFYAREPGAAGERIVDTLAAITSQLGQFLERLRAEEALHRQAADLLQANIQLEKAAQMKSVFLASMSHELRTPLTGVLGMSETLLDQVYGPLNERQLRYVGVIEKSGRQLLALINDLLEFAKIDAGHEELTLHSCTIEELCTPSVDLAKAFAARRKQNVSFENAAPGVSVRVDVQRMEKVLNNLLGNAGKFTPEGGEYGLRASVVNDELCFTVWDRGIGIAAADLGRLFVPFVQLDARLARRYDGTGLGLALVKYLVELHDGRVTVRSEIGKGSEFSVTLPLRTHSILEGKSKTM